MYFIGKSSVFSLKHVSKTTIKSLLINILNRIIAKHYSLKKNVNKFIIKSYYIRSGT